MSNTPVDMPKVTQMLDAGWTVRLWKNDMGTYEARGLHQNETVMSTVRGALVARLPDDPETYRDLYGDQSPWEVVEEFDFDGSELMTDDFTPEQALTRLAYKVFGEII